MSTIMKNLNSLGISLFSKARQQVNFHMPLDETIQVEPLNDKLEEEHARLVSQVKSKTSLIMSLREEVPAQLTAGARDAIHVVNQRYAIPSAEEAKADAEAHKHPHVSTSRGSRADRGRGDADRDKDGQKAAKRMRPSDALVAQLRDEAVETEAVSMPDSTVVRLAVTLQKQVSKDSQAVESTAAQGLGACRTNLAVIQSDN
jgi:hypothetical protein